MLDQKLFDCDCSNIVTNNKYVEEIKEFVSIILSALFISNVAVGTFIFFINKGN